jgi:hypothetical protein
MEEGRNERMNEGRNKGKAVSQFINIYHIPMIYQLKNTIGILRVENIHNVGLLTLTTDMIEKLCEY